MKHLIGSGVLMWIALTASPLSAQYTPDVLVLDGPLYLNALLRDRDGLGIMIAEQSAIAAFDFTAGTMHRMPISHDSDSMAILVDGARLGLRK